MDIHALFALSRSMQRRPFRQPAALTTPRSCGGCRATSRQRLVWPLCKAMTTVLRPSSFMQRRPFKQPGAVTNGHANGSGVMATIPSSCGGNSEILPSPPLACFHFGCCGGVHRSAAHRLLIITRFSKMSCLEHIRWLRRKLRATGCYSGPAQGNTALRAKPGAI
jgi:hypothetical protein